VVLYLCLLFSYPRLMHFSTAKSNEQAISTEQLDHFETSALASKVQRNLENKEPADSFFELIMRESERRNIGDEELQQAIKAISKERSGFASIVKDQVKMAGGQIEASFKICRLISQLDHEVLTKEDIIWLANNAFGLKERDWNLPAMLKFVNTPKHVVHRIYDEKLFHDRQIAATLNKIQKYL